MTPRAAFGLRANRQVADASKWYEEQRPGLGVEFLKAVVETVERLRRMPESGRIVYRDIRRVPIQGFPWAIYYRVPESALNIRGCLHDRRNARVRELIERYMAGLIRL